MGKSDLMDRVATDLAQGHTHHALQRLHSLIAAHPTDLDLRRQLADVYRLTGNLVEAGRWSYLDEFADSDETAAFERAFPSLARRRAALRWPDAALPPTDWVRQRLAALPITVHQKPTQRSRGSVYIRLGAIAVLGSLAGVGIFAILERLIQ